MVGDPALSGLGLAVSAVRSIWGAYTAYEVGKIKETDEGLRDEVRRRLGMIRNHVNSMDDRLLTSRHADGLEVCKRLRISLEVFETDLAMGISGTIGSVHPQAEKTKKKDIRQLVDHDKATLERLVKVTHHANASMTAMTESNEDQSVTELSMLEQELVQARNHFSERHSLLGRIGV